MNNTAEDKKVDRQKYHFFSGRMKKVISNYYDN